MTAVIIVTGFASLILIILFRTALCSEKKYSVAQLDTDWVDADSAAAHLSGAIRIQTIGYDDITQTDYSAFAALASYLEKTYPRVHSVLDRESVNGSSLLYHW